MIVLLQYRNALSLVVGGVVRERRDDAARVFRAYDEQGAETSTLAYDAAENADADARATAATEASNETTLREQIRTQIDALKAIVGATTDPAGTNTLRAIRATSNTTINSSPAAYIKALAGFLIDVSQAQVRTSKVMVRAVSDTISAPASSPP